MPQNYVMPANSIIVHGKPLDEEFEAAPESAILPGDLVEFNTDYCADGLVKIKEAAVNTERALGFADTSHEEDDDHVYVAGEAVRVMNGDIVLKARLAAGNAITCGDNLKPAASGELAELDCEAGTSDPAENACLLVGRARMSLASATTWQWLIIKCMI